MINKLVDQAKPYLDFIFLAVIVAALLICIIGALIATLISYKVGMAIMLGDVFVILAGCALGCFISLGWLLVTTWKEGSERARNKKLAETWKAERWSK